MCKLWGKWRLIWPFSLILILHLIAVVLFTRGFLLTRTELSDYSGCSDLSNCPCEKTSFSQLIDSKTSTTLDSDQYCWTKPAVDRVVIIILDALRFDFVAPSAFFEEVKPWMNKLKVLQQIASDGKTSAKIFKAIADPPTTSLQRLKGLTTGALPTFIDVGNSFGASAITEDNFIHQLVRNRKRITMMGDDTWLQLFPTHFEKAYPYPSFNVKDLHTVDDGVIDHLLPSLNEGNWDVLIAHFLGVDHAGHIFGVDSQPMMEKLEQYNEILETVIDALKNQSDGRGFHENTLLLVMGDHGQTINGDHGGGTAEEVETAIFAMSLKKSLTTLPHELDSSTCKVDWNGRKVCTSSIQQLDFAVTLSALLGIPFPFGSIGRVNPELYSLGTGSFNVESVNVSSCNQFSSSPTWLENYINVLCLNSWQVKRYIDFYSKSSVIGFSSKDMLLVADMYDQAQSMWLNRTRNKSSFENEDEAIKSCYESESMAKEQINAYSTFLATVVDLARSKWTEFDLKLMSIALGIMLLSIVLHIFLIWKEDKILGSSTNQSENSIRTLFAFFVVTTRACSFLSNSYILSEGKVANFLLATTGIFNLKFSLMKKKIRIEAVAFLLLNILIGLGVENGPSKEISSDSTSTSSYTLGMNIFEEGKLILKIFLEILPVVFLALLSAFLYKGTMHITCWKLLKYFFLSGTFLSFVLIVLHWVLESRVLPVPMSLQATGRNLIPRMVYAIGFGMLILLSLTKIFDSNSTWNCEESTYVAAVAMLSAWSSTLLMLMGRHGPLIALISMFGGWCIIRMQNVTRININDISMDIIPVVQWSLLAVSLFFYSGHRCTFDGLRYGAAFIGFDEFNLFRQGILLAIDTFGISHVLPIMSLPFIVVFHLHCCHSKQGRQIFFKKLNKVFLMYGLINAFTTTFTIICVTIQRRHLMVWGLFAPKYVFDVIGLLVTDILVFLASFYYY